MDKTSERPEIRRISWLVWAVLAVLLVVLASAFAQALALNRTLRAKVAILEPMLAEQQQLNATLQAQLDYVQSDTYVEAWAQEHAGMVRPGETLVIPLAATPTPTPTPTSTPAPTPTPMFFWERWWQALFGD